MNVITNGNITKIGDKIRVEPGPKRKIAVATEELLNDEVTAKHYHVGGVDALGVTIELGQPMNYIDWKKKHEPDFYVYQADENGRFLKVGTHPTMDEAMTQAFALAMAAAISDQE